MIPSYAVQSTPLVINSHLSINKLLMSLYLWETTILFRQEMRDMDSEVSIRNGNSQNEAQKDLQKPTWFMINEELFLWSLSRLNIQLSLRSGTLLSRELLPEDSQLYYLVTLT